jgi:dihydrodipicolinate synthase/N-acetylneuraminate lyase
MDGIGPPLVTPFDRDGGLDEASLRELVGWVEDRGVDFLVPCGSNSEAELMSSDERARVVEVVVEEASVPVLAGTGHPGLRETLDQTERAAEAGADAALVVTPFYYGHDEADLEAYYESVADGAELPVYLYSVPAYTGVALDPATVGRLADHRNVAGMKDSSGDLERFVRERRATDGSAGTPPDDAEAGSAAGGDPEAATDFDLFVGSGGILAASSPSATSARTASGPTPAAS